MRRAIILAAVLAAGAARAFDASPLLQFVTAQSWTPASLNPVAWYKGDGNALDSASTNNGTWTGTAAYATAVNSQGFAFDGTNYVSTGSATLGNGLFAISNRTWSAAMWVKTRNQFSMPLARAGVTGNLRTFQIFIDTNGGIIPNATPRFVLRGADTDTALGHNLSADWHHYAVTWDGTTARFYLNGAFWGNLNVGTAAEEDSQMILIGARTSGDRILPGFNDDTLIFNRALTQSEITQLYNWRQ